MNSNADGSPLTSAVSVLVTVDNGTQTAGGGTASHKGNGAWNYAPTQAETNGNHLAFTFTHATGVNQTVNVYTVSYDPHDTVRLGITALPNAAAGANTGLPVLDANLLVNADVERWVGAVVNALVSGRVDSSVGAMAANVLTAAAIAADAITDAKVASDVTIASVTGSVGSVTGAVGSVTGLTASNLDAAISSRMATYTQPTGFLAATFPTGTISNTTNITAGTITTTTFLTNAPTAGDFTATMKTSLNASTPAVTVSDKTGFALTAAYDAAKTASQAGDAMALTAGERTTLAGVVHTTQMTESYRANGAAPTLAQSHFEMLAHLGEAAISGTTKTINKLDHVTAAETFTLDSATDPASITRAT